jgi:NAD(P)-dependent dehydrogenase (short-subunit alcohol dehydrogenase family)
MASTYPSFTRTYHHDQYPAIDPTQPRLDCSQKIVLITGGGRGIGKAIAIGFAKAHATGIALLGRTRSSLEEAAAEVQKVSGGKTDVHIVTADIIVQGQVIKAMDSIINHLDETVPDILVNNAGGMLGLGGLDDLDIDEFMRAYDLNVKGPLTVLQTYLRANRHHSPDTLQGLSSTCHPAPRTCPSH